MPLVRIDVIRDAWSPSELKNLGDTIQQVMQTHFNAPARDRYQVRWEPTFFLMYEALPSPCSLQVISRSLPNTKIMSLSVKTLTWASLEPKSS